MVRVDSCLTFLTIFDFPQLLKIGSKSKLLYDKIELREFITISKMTIWKRIVNAVHKMPNNWFTYPIIWWAVFFAVVTYCVKQNHHHKCWIVGKGCLGTAELSLVHNIQPCGEENNPGNAVKWCLQKKEHQAWSCQRVLLCSVSAKKVLFFSFIRKIEDRSWFPYLIL